MTLCESQANARHGIIKSVCSTDKCGPIRFLRIDIRSMVGERKFTVVFLFKHKQSRSSPYISFLLHTVSPKFCVNVLEHGRWSYCSFFTHRLFNNFICIISMNIIFLKIEKLTKNHKLQKNALFFHFDLFNDLDHQCCVGRDGLTTIPH